MTRNVYFDTNVFDHIHKKIGVSESDLMALDSAVKTKKISILLSTVNLEEALSALAPRRKLAIEELQLIIELTNGQKLLKAPDQLLSDDINSYALADLSSQPFIVDTELQAELLRTLQNPNQKDMTKLLSVAKVIKKEKEGFKAGIKQARENVLREKRNLGGKPPSFSDLWESSADKFAESLAERVGVLDACKERGIKGLLEIRSVRLYVGANLSLIYAQTFKGSTPKMGDCGDMHHAILASAADTFVTQDKKLARLLSRVSIKDFEVVDLNGLFKLIC